MTATIKTLEIKMADKVVPLTKAIVHQLETFPTGLTLDSNIELIGSVSLPEHLLYLFNTPHGIQVARWMPDKWRRQDCPRIVLVK